MTQVSLPQTGHISDSVSPDAGPYSAPQWAASWANLMTTHPDQGPIGFPEDDTLEVKNPSGSSITVEAGAAVVGGRSFDSDAVMTFSVPASFGESRIDVVVVVQNESASPVTAGIASGENLVFPTSLTDYQGSASIPPYTSRLAILQGTPNDPPSAPTLDQNPDLLYMIPLAQYEISTGGVITELTNLRNYTLGAGGGSVNVSDYWLVSETNETFTAYNGRTKIIPMWLRFDFGVSDSNVIISFSGEPDPHMGLEDYATIFLFHIDDVSRVGTYTIHWYDSTALNIKMERTGYVTSGGTATAAPSGAETKYAHGIMIQLLDVPPINNPDIPT